MDRKTAKALLPFIEAYVDGEDIQYGDGEGLWVDDPDFLGADFMGLHYRIKPKPREWFIDPESLLVHDGPRSHLAAGHLYIKVREVIE